MADDVPPQPPPYPPPYPPPPPVPLGPGEYAPTPDERSTGMLAHLGPVLANYVLGGQGWLVALVIYFAKKDSRFVAFHALEELFLQIGVAVSTIVLLVVGLFLCGLPWLLIPVVWIGAMIYGIVAGLAANRGEWYEYAMVGRMSKNSVLTSPAAAPSYPPPPPPSPPPAAP